MNTFSYMTIYIHRETYSTPLHFLAMILTGNRIKYLSFLLDSDIIIDIFHFDPGYPMEAMSILLCNCIGGKSHLNENSVEIGNAYVFFNLGESYPNNLLLTLYISLSSASGSHTVYFFYP